MTIAHPMSDGNSLDGLSVLVVEDDFYLADDTSYALEQAGALVLGPFADFDEARGSIVRTRPDCAVLDINLGNGPDFSSARVMLSEGVPVMFVTGYDRAAIPDSLSHVECMQKPTTGRRIVQAVQRLCKR